VDRGRLIIYIAPNGRFPAGRGGKPLFMTSTSDDSTFAEIVGTEVDTSDRLAAIDHQIATLSARVKATSPRFAALVPHYQADIDALLDLRLWLTDATV